MAAVNGRRLFEMLQEPQEPFFLDVYLVERGCSGRLLPTTRQPCVICWPAGGAACERLQRLTGRHCRTWRQVLIKNILNWVDKSPSLGAAEFHGKGRTDRALKLTAIDPARSNRVGFQVPVKVVSMFNELLDFAYSPAFYLLLGSSSDALLPERDKAEGRKTSISTERREGDNPTDVEQLTASELTASTAEWSKFKHQIEEVGTEIEAELFEDIKQETVLIMLSFHCKFKRSSSSAAAAAEAL